MTSHAQPNAPARIRVGHYDFDPVTARQAIDHILAALARGQGGWVVTANLDFLRRMHADHAFRTLCEGATLRVADGWPVVAASKLQRTPLPERVTGSDMIVNLSAAAADARRSVFFLGGDEGTAEKAATALRERLPALPVAGTLFPPFGFEHDPAFMRRIETELAASGPDIVYVGLSSPKAENLIVRLRSVRPETWFIGVGVSFSFVSGDVRRAPPWVQRLHMEWFHRFIQEPRKLWRRYFQHGIFYALRLFASCARKGLAS
jgi:N-acetylglucosaminyldiphosphoundecaprenol N-acetyl-beta-D-mannosaminyltransferase